MDYELICLRPGELLPERRHPTIQSQQLMITVAWNTVGFHVLAALLKGTRFSNSYYTTEIFENIR
jgi:hypothetical protein